MKFAVANQFFMIADQAGVDYTNVLRAIREDYPRAADLPGPGFAAGPCLFKDTMQLAAFTADHFPLGQAAMQVNEGLPAYIVSALERRYGGLTGKTVGHPRAWRSRPSPTTPGRRSATSCASCSRGPARASCAPIRTSRTTGCVPLDVRPRGERHPGPRRAAQAVPRPRGRRQGRRRRLGRPRRGDPAVVRILVTGAAGFINGYLVPELLDAGHEVVGLDNFSKYGRLTKSYDDHPRYRFVEGDAKDVALMTRARGRLRPGRRGRGDDRRHQLLPRVRLRPAGRERADPRVDVRRGDRRPPGRPARADHRRQQLDGLRVRDGLPDARGRPADLAAADLDLRLPEARLRVLRQGRLGAVPAAVHDRAAVQLRRHRRAPRAPRHGHHERQREARPEPRRARPRRTRSSRARTRCTSSARATRSATTPTAATSPTASASRWSRRRRVNDDFNLSTAASTTVLELAEAIWHKIHADGRPFRYVSDPPFEHDVQLRVPDVRKAREVLGFEATTTLDQMLDEVIPWIRAELEAGTTLMTDAGAVGRRSPGLQGRRGGRAGPAGARRAAITDAARDPRRLRLRRGPDRAGHRAARRRAAGRPRAPQRPRPRRAQRDEGRASPASSGAYVLISMADGSDEPHVVDSMVELARDGADVVVGVALHARRPPDRRAAAQAADEPDRRADPALVRRRRRPTTRPTTSSSTRAASSTPSTIESTAGFELALELTVKATLAGRRVAEVPTTWRDRTAGQSNFKLRKWLPHYLHWYWAAFRGRLDRLARRRVRVGR